MEFSADTLRLNLIDLARTGSKLIQVAGRVAYNCPSGDPQDPVTFTTKDSHLVINVDAIQSFFFSVHFFSRSIFLSFCFHPSSIYPFQYTLQS